MYKFKKQVFDSIGAEVETQNFTVPSNSVSTVIRILQSEGYEVVENDYFFKSLSNVTFHEDNRTYSRYSIFLI